jgi:hypothetical protein
MLKEGQESRYALKPACGARKKIADPHGDKEHVIRATRFSKGQRESCALRTVARVKTDMEFADVVGAIRTNSSSKNQLSKGRLLLVLAKGPTKRVKRLLEMLQELFRHFGVVITKRSQYFRRPDCSILTEPR